MDGFTYLHAPLFRPASAGAPEQPWPDGGCHVITRPIRYSGQRLV